MACHNTTEVDFLTSIHNGVRFKTCAIFARLFSIKFSAILYSTDEGQRKEVHLKTYILIDESTKEEQSCMTFTPFLSLVTWSYQITWFFLQILASILHRWYFCCKPLFDCLTNIPLNVVLWYCKFLVFIRICRLYKSLNWILTIEIWSEREISDKKLWNRSIYWSHLNLWKMMWSTYSHIFMAERCRKCLNCNIIGKAIEGSGKAGLMHAFWMHYIELYSSGKIWFATFSKLSFSSCIIH